MVDEPISRARVQWMLSHLVSAGVRYGRDLAILLVALPDGVADAGLEARFATVLRDADVMARWEPGTLLVVLPDTDRAGAAGTAARLGEAAGERTAPLAIGAAHWAGDTVDELLARAGRALDAARGVPDIS